MLFFFDLQDLISDITCLEIIFRQDKIICFFYFIVENGVKTDRYIRRAGSTL